MLKVFLILLAVILFFGLLAICIVFSIRSRIRKNRKKGGIHLGFQNDISKASNEYEISGINGERNIDERLRRLLKEDEYIFTNILLPTRNNRTIEIDAVIVSRKGIFCIEIKTWVGCITGNDKDKYWLQEYGDPSREPKNHNNPVLQNDKHCGILERILRRNDIYCIVILTIFEGGEIESNYTYTFNEFKNFYNELNDNELTIEQINAIANKLIKYIPSSSQMEKHINEVKRDHLN